MKYPMTVIGQNVVIDCGSHDEAMRIIDRVSVAPSPDAPLGHGYSPRPEWAGTCPRCGATPGEDCAVLTAPSPETPGLREAAEAMMLGGQHDGPCDNDGDDTQSCTVHLDTAERRRSAVRAALAATPEDRTP